MVNGPCIPWDSTHIKPNGYGWLSVKGKVIYAHRFVLGMPAGQVDHLCHNEAAARGECFGGSGCLHRRCVNPAHLAVRTVAENLASTPLGNVAKRQRTHCAAGHEFTPENTIWERRKRGYVGRKCRACKNARDRARHVPKPRTPTTKDPISGRFISSPTLR